MSLLAAILLCAAVQDRTPAELKEILKDPEKVVPFKDCEPLIALLREGKVKEFNEQRRALKEKYLDFGDFLKGRYKRDAFLNLDLQGIDLSRVLFGSTRFNGCALDQSDFSGSYLQEVRFYEPPSLGDAGGAGDRPTTLAGATFRGSILAAGTGWFGLQYVDPSRIVADGAVEAWIGSDAYRRISDRRVRELVAGASSLELSAIGSRGTPIDLKDYGVEIENPFARLDAAAEKEWKAAGIDPASLKALKALRINAQANFDWVNADPRTLFVLGEGFFTMGTLYSRGPILLTGRAHVMGDLFSDSWVGSFHQANPRGLIHASRILFSSPGHARSLMSPVTRGDFGLGKKGEDWLRRMLETQSVKSLAAKLHPVDRGVLAAESLGTKTTLKEVNGEGPSPFAEELPVLLLDGKQMETLDHRTVVIHDDPKVIVAVPCVFRNQVENLYSEGPVLILDRDSRWSPPVIVSRNVVRCQRAKQLPYRTVAFDPPPAAAGFEPDRRSRKPLPSPIPGSGIGGPDISSLIGGKLSLVTISSEGTVTHTILAAGPLDTRLGPGWKYVMGKTEIGERAPQGVYVGFPDTGFKRAGVDVTDNLARKFRKYEAENKNATLADFLRTLPIANDPLVRKLLDSVK